MNRLRSMRAAALAAATLLAADAVAVNVPLGTFIYAGRAMNYRHEVLTGEDDVMIQAVATNGVVLASCKVFEADDTGVNFLLEVPVAAEANDRAAAIGDTLNCLVVSATGATNATTRPLPPVTEANAVASCDIVWYDATDFAYGDDGATVPVPKAYLQGLDYFMRQAGHDAYDPAADWDGDGADNYSEYVAGTNPFDPSDLLRIRDFRVAGGEGLVTFEYVGGHLYALQAAESLVEPEWMAAEFRTVPGGGLRTVAVIKDADGDAGLVTLYATPAANATNMFYRVEVK
jgi:hypothetical protein